jgi:SAM-dependent methyltransferase
MLGGSPFQAPLQDAAAINKAVDVGCGTGIATIQIASVAPFARVYGLDISPVPKSVQEMSPQNVIWAEGNVLDVNGSDTQTTGIAHEIFSTGSLDYIFGRMLFLGINNWAKYFATAANSLSAGGVIEHQDLDWKFYRVGTSECLSDNWEWHKAVVEAARKSGLSTEAGSDAAAHMRDSGLEILGTRTFEFSFVPSDKTPNSRAMGSYVQAKLLPQYPELLRKMLSSQGHSEEQIQRLTDQCLQDISSEEGIHQKYTVTIARKS